MDFPHNRTLFGWFRQGVSDGMRREGRILLADEMGLGKTLQALSLAAQYREECLSCEDLGFKSMAHDTWKIVQQISRDQFLIWNPPMQPTHNLKFETAWGGQFWWCALHPYAGFGKNKLRPGSVTLCSLRMCRSSRKAQKVTEQFMRSHVMLPLYVAKI